MPSPNSSPRTIPILSLSLSRGNSSAIRQRPSLTWATLVVFPLKRLLCNMLSLCSEKLSARRSFPQWRKSAWRVHLPRNSASSHGKTSTFGRLFKGLWCVRLSLIVSCGHFVRHVLGTSYVPAHHFDRLWACGVLRRSCAVNDRKRAYVLSLWERRKRDIRRWIQCRN